MKQQYYNMHNTLCDNEKKKKKTKYIQTANFLYYFNQNISSILISYLHFAAGNNVQIQQQTLEQNVIYTTKQNKTAINNENDAIKQ